MYKITRALISCTDKSGLEEFGKFLAGQDVQILSTGGTASLLRKADIPVTDVSDHTGSPEILDGRLKTLHPKIHGGILNIRENKDHQKQIADNDIQPIDLVVVNLYEFEKTINNPRSTIHDAIENIDIGGPTMLRSAAKNYKDVAVVIDPKDYARVMDEVQKTGTLSEAFRFELACKVFASTSSYDTAISSYLQKQLKVEGQASEELLPEGLALELTKVQDLRYGENPQQKAALYQEKGLAKGIIQAEQIQGKELSFNNIMDMESAWNCCLEFSNTACVIVKHMNPCGVAMADKLSDAFLKARAGDPVSCFGGIVAFNRPIDKQTATIMAETFFEVIIAPDYEKEALEIFSKKKNLRIMKHKLDSSQGANDWDYRRISGGMLVQERDTAMADLKSCDVVTKRSPSEAELDDLGFAWKVVKHVKSNAIVFAKDRQILGVGAGQMSRVDSVKIAAMKAKENFKNEDVLKGAAMASDAFFPFRDGLDQAAQYGIKAVVEPGGSMRDKEVIEACDEQDVAMVFTKMRHFRH